MSALAEREGDELRCLDARFDDPREAGCHGPVEYRMALSASGRSFPRCEAHWHARLEDQERINRDYPDSPIPPAWFDPSAAGESWDEP